MSSALSGLAAFRDAVAPPTTYEKGEWAKFQKGKTYRVRFMSEIDVDSPHYDPARGSALLVREHESPLDFTRRALCTKEDEGRCYACEQNAADRNSGWYPKKRAYFNVLIEDESGDRSVAIWKLTVGPRASNSNMLLTYTGEEGGISNNWWTVTRSGDGRDTTYSLLPKAQDAEPFDYSDYEAFDLSKTAVRRIPYADQEEYYGGSRGVSKPRSTDSGSASNDLWL